MKKRGSLLQLWTSVITFWSSVYLSLWGLYLCTVSILDMKEKYSKKKRMAQEQGRQRAKSLQTPVLIILLQDHAALPWVP